MPSNYFLSFFQVHFADPLYNNRKDPEAVHDVFVARHGSKDVADQVNN
jgi:hypothetical protein